MNNIKMYPELRALIILKFGKQDAFARAINMNSSTLSAKLNGKSQWTFKEVVSACKALDIPLSEADRIFFG